MMPLDFTSWFVGALLVGLFIVAIGTANWSGLRGSPFGIFITVVGAILSVFCLVGLVADQISKLTHK